MCSEYQYLPAGTQSSNRGIQKQFKKQCKKKKKKKKKQCKAQGTVKEKKTNSKVMVNYLFLGWNIFVKTSLKYLFLWMF